MRRTWSKPAPLALQVTAVERSGAAIVRLHGLATGDLPWSLTLPEAIRGIKAGHYVLCVRHGTRVFDVVPVSQAGAETLVVMDGAEDLLARLPLR